MIKALAFSFVILLILWVVNILISNPLRCRVGEHDLLFKKVVHNGNDLFYGVFGLLGLAIAWYAFAPLKWVLLVIYGVYALIGIMFLLFSLIPTIIIAVKLKQNQFNELIVCGSNFIGILGSILILYLTVHYLFNWI